MHTARGSLHRCSVCRIQAAISALCWIIWLCGPGAFMTEVKTSSELRKALSPLEPMSESSREFLRERLFRATVRKLPDDVRRWTGLKRCATRRNSKSNGTLRPTMVDELHWRDLRAGALFFAARDAAITLLDEIESHIGNSSRSAYVSGCPAPGSCSSQARIAPKTCPNLP